MNTLKRIAAVLLAVCLFPASAIRDAQADHYVYKHRFTILAEDMSPEETAFRQWAADLVSAYRDEYCFLQEVSKDKGSQGTDFMAFENLQTAPVKVMELDYNWLTKVCETTYRDAVREKALFMPYYWLAAQKRLFDGTSDALTTNRFGKNTREVPYSDWDIRQDPAKRQEIYIWMLSEMLKQKIETDPSLLTGTEYIDPNVKGSYTYDMTTGTLKFDPELAAVQLQSYDDYVADILTVVVDTVEVTIRSWLAVKDIKGTARELYDSVAEKLSDPYADVKKVMEDYLDDLIDTLLDSVSDALKDLIGKIRDNAKNELANQLRGYLAVSLANAVLNGNRNVIGYLRSTYVDHPSRMAEQKLVLSDNSRSVDHRTEFIQAVNALIARIDSDDMRNLSEQEVLKEVSSYALDDVMGTEEILSAGTIAFKVMTSFAIDLVTGTAEDTRKMLSSLVDKQMKGKGTAGTVVTELKGWLLDDIAARLLERLTEGLKKGFDEIDPDSFSDDYFELLVQVSDALDGVKKKIHEEMDWDHFPEFALTSGLKRLGNIFIKAPYAKENDADDPFGFKGVMKKVSDGDFDGTKDKDLGTFVLAVLATWCRSAFVPYQEGLGKRFPFLNEYEKAQLKDTVKDLGKAANGMAIDFSADSFSGVIVSLTDHVVVLTSLDAAYPDSNILRNALEEAGTAAKYVCFISEDDGSEEYRRYRDAHADTRILTEMMKNDKLWSHLAACLLNSTDTEELFTRAIKSEIYLNNSEALNIVNWQTLSEIQGKADGLIYRKLGAMMIVKTFTKSAGDIWDSATDLGGSIITAYYSTKDTQTGEDLVSLQAQRINAVYGNSSALMMELVRNTAGGIRTSLFRDGKTDVLMSMEGELKNTTFERKNMNPSEILNRDLTPDIGSIRELTDDILTQMNLDAVGMAVYLDMVENRSVYAGCDFYDKYVNREGVLLSEAETYSRLRRIIRMMNQFESEYQNEWNSLTGK